MRIEKLRQPINQLYILGAGASFALSTVKARKNAFARSTTPLDRDFLSRLKKLYAKKKGWRKKSLELLEAEWIDTDDFYDHPLESAIIKRASQYDFLSAIHPKRTSRKVANTVYLNHLTHLLADYLYQCKSNSTGNTHEFMEKTYPKGKDASSYENRIITFNYDTLIDRQLIERGLSKKKIYFDRIALSKDDKSNRNADDHFSSPLIVKLHGSVNWRCKRSYFDSIVSGTVVDGGEREQIWVDDSSSPNPHDDESPLIIPPIPNKPITQARIFRYLWTVAYEYLHQAAELVIIGYSCPQTDMLARTMFAQFYTGRRRGGRSLKVTIVDPDSTSISKYQRMIARENAARIEWSYFTDFASYMSHTRS
jgi:hypothetical protein